MTHENEYKGHPVLVFEARRWRDADGALYTRSEVTLGLRKIRAVLENLDAARAFVDAHGATRKEKPPQQKE